MNNMYKKNTSLFSGSDMSDQTVNNNNNIGHLYCAVPILIYSTAHYIISDILAGILEG